MCMLQALLGDGLSLTPHEPCMGAPLPYLLLRMEQRVGGGPDGPSRWSGGRSFSALRPCRGSTRSYGKDAAHAGHCTRAWASGRGRLDRRGYTRL